VITRTLRVLAALDKRGVGMSFKEHTEDLFASIAAKVAEATGSFWAFSIASLVIIVWALSGPVFHFSDTWQLVINTSTTIVTFLMVFVIQHAQNRDTRAMHLKLNELIAALEGASNRLIDVEDLTDEELRALTARYRHLSTTAELLLPGAKLTIDRERESTPDAKAGAAKQAHGGKPQPPG
jgi:low affinity Fe/Cu permease